MSKRCARTNSGTRTKHTLYWQRTTRPLRLHSIRRHFCVAPVCCARIEFRVAVAAVSLQYCHAGPHNRVIIPRIIIQPAAVAVGATGDVVVVVNELCVTLYS